MWQRLIRCLASMMLAIAIVTPTAQAQDKPPDRMIYTGKSAEEMERGPPVLPYTLAFLSIILIMLILCMPSRKGVSSQ